MNFDRAVFLLISHLTDLQAVYLFGIQASLGWVNQDSDIDLAMPSSTPVTVKTLWELSGRLAGELGKDVDLVDLREASTVMRYQVVQQGKRLWRRDSYADEFELTVLSEYWDWDITRRGLLDDIRHRGSVYG